MTAPVTWLCACLAMLAAPSGQPAPAAPGPFSVAFLHGDGRLVPVGTFDGQAWSPLTRIAGSWHVWLLDDPAVKASPFAPRAPRTIAPGHGSGRCAAADLPDARGAADQVVGVATTDASVPVDLLATLAVDTDLGRWIVERTAGPFHRAEEDTLSVERDELPPGFPNFAARQGLPIVWTRIVRHGLAQAATRTYYLEGRKDYEAFSGRLDIGRIRTTGHVFVQIGGGRETADAEVDLSDVDGKQSIFRTPVAVIRAGTAAFWLFTVRSYGAATYDIMEVSGPSRRPLVVLQAAAGC